MITFARFWNIKAAPISNQTHTTCAIFNTWSSNLHQRVQRDQPIISMKYILNMLIVLLMKCGEMVSKQEFCLILKRKTRFVCVRIWIWLDGGVQVSLRLRRRVPPVSGAGGRPGQPLRRPALLQRGRPSVLPTAAAAAAAATTTTAAATAAAATAPQCGRLSSGRATPETLPGMAGAGRGLAVRGARSVRLASLPVARPLQNRRRHSLGQERRPRRPDTAAGRPLEPIRWVSRVLTGFTEFCRAAVCCGAFHRVSPNLFVG